LDIDCSNDIPDYPFSQKSTLKSLLSGRLFPEFYSLLIYQFFGIGLPTQRKVGTWVQTASLNSFYFIIWQFCNSPLNAILFLSGFIGFSIVSVKSKNILHEYISLWFWIPFGVMFFISLPHKLSIPMFTERYVSFVFPAFFIGISIISILIEKYSSKEIFKLSTNDLYSIDDCFFKTQTK